MNDAKQLETNLYESFKRVKSDVIQLSNEINKLSMSLSKVIGDVGKNRDKIDIAATKAADLDKYFKQHVAALHKNANVRPKTVVVERVKKVVAKHKKKTYVASETGKKFHLTNCIFAKNIKPKSLVKFKSKNAMLNKGYKPCACVQK